jgi:uncharacterized protein (TIGR03083 family)
MTNPEPEKLPVVPSSIRDSAEAELKRVTDFVAGLSVDDWKKPSAATGWTIGDVVAHLDLALGLYNRMLGMVTSGGGSGSVWRAIGRMGEKVAPAASPLFHSVNSAIPKLIDRALAPEVLKGQFAAGSRRVQERLAGIGGEDYTRPVYYIGGPYPLSFFLAVMVNELAMHLWDMESQMVPDATVSVDARAVLPWLYWSATKMMFHPPKGTAGTIQILVDDPGAAMWFRFGETEEQGTGTTATPDATIRGPSGTYVLALAGRIPAEEALRDTSLTAEGDEALARTFLSSWKFL